MNELLNESILNRKSEMYAMVISIEADLIENFNNKLTLDNIPREIMEKANRVKEEQNQLLSILKGLDIQAYIQICNANILKLGINTSQRHFLNTEITKIIPIRNAVMHPRPLGFFDYPMLKTVFDQIPKELNCFTWENTEMTSVQIKEHPETFLPPPESLRKSNRIIENLPSFVDYEETSFIGRKKEISEIQAQLNRKNVSILSIIGDGGVGKTAITLKLLYDMLDDPNCKYELIIWASLKTNELSDHDFAEIKNSINSAAQMYEKLAPFIGGDSLKDTKDFIIELAQNFNTLFVLDNLETLNIADIREFIDRFSEYGQVLITSRIGLGEMEHRYKLNGLNDSDVLQYADRLLELYGYECLYTNERKKQLFCGELHSNPLAIKWFIRCLYNGQTEESILNHKSDLINFCMANVYDKLSDDAHAVLDILTVAGVELSFPELIYYMECELSQCVRMKYAVNELGKCNFISEEKFRREQQVSVTEFAHEFLTLHFTDTRHLLSRFKELEQKLRAFSQQLLINISEDPYNIHSIRYRNKGQLVVASFLHNALKRYKMSEWEDSAFELIKFAQELLPQYYENNLILAHIYGPSSPLKAKSEYIKAIKYSDSKDEKIRSHIIFADFLIRMNEYSDAISVLDKVEVLSPDCLDIHFEKAKAYSCIGQYDAATKELDILETKHITNTLKNKIIAKRADILEREANRIDIRETQRRFYYLKQAFEELELAKCKDKIIYDYMVEILLNIAFLYMDDEALNYILEKVKTHYTDLRRSAKYREFRSYINEKESQITNTDFVSKISAFIKNYNDYLYLLKPNEAYIYTLKHGYGFCRNSKYSSGIYFSMTGLPIDLCYGDIIQYSSLFISRNGPQAINPRLIDKMETRIMNGK